MLIKYKNTSGKISIVDIDVNDNSYRYRAIKGEHALTLYFSLAQHVEIPVGAWCEYENERYELVKPSNFKKNNTRNFEYTLIMEAQQAKLRKYKFRNTVDRRLKFSLTARPAEHLQMLVDNLNQRDSGWTVGECVNAVEKMISYNHAFCMDALGQMSDEFETEYEIVGKTIHLHKLEYNKENPLSLSYGKGNGFMPGIGRTNYDNSKPIEVLYVQGGEENIDASKYLSRELLLPKDATLQYDGTYFEGGDNFDTTMARTYITDVDGFSIRRSDKALITGEEDSLDCSHIYPKRIGTISKVEVVDTAKNFYDFIDSSIPADLNYKDCLIEGETMTVIFQSGMLAGKEFEVKYYHESKTINGVVKAARRFEIIPQEIDGITMPNDTFKPVAGQDSYAVFNISLPAAYVCNNVDKSGASWDMFRESVKYLYENEEQKFSFTGELDGNWAKRDWTNIGGKIRLGGYILFSDTQFQQASVAIRIVGIKDYINKPHSPEIELSNQVIGSSFTSTLGKIEENEVVMEDNRKEALQFTKRRFRDSQETISALEEAMEANFSSFSNSVNPIAIQTMALLVGDESLQFVFVQSLSSIIEVPHNVTYNNITKKLTSPAGFLQHKTLGINSISSEHSDFKTWSVSEFISSVLTDSKQKYYLYSRVSKTTQTGEFRLSPIPISIEKETGYYHLLLGILNSEFDGNRSYVPLYGYTEILPGRVTTDRVVSADGLNFIDFVNNAARIGNNSTYIDFNTNSDGQLRLKGTLFQSPSGAESPVGVFRGVFNTSSPYYIGDEVTYLGSTYRCRQITTSGILPTNTSYWSIIAAKGDQGNTGQTGFSGLSGPMVLFLGDYAENKEYTGNNTRVDVVKYGNITYKTKTTAGTFRNVTPSTSSDKWELFGGQFESVATSLLLAELANIGGLIFKNNKLISQKGTINGVDSTDYSNPNFVPNVIIDGNNGEIIAQGKFYSGNNTIGSVRIEGSKLTVVDKRGTVMEFGILNPGASNEPVLQIRYREADGFNSYTTSVFGTAIVLKRENFTVGNTTYSGGSLILSNNSITSVGFKRSGGDLSRNEWYIDDDNYVRVFNPF